MAIKESKEYYTAAQVKKILGITDGMLYNYVDNGALERIIPPGKKQGVYRRKDVDALAREVQTFIIERKKRTTKLIKVTTKEDLNECMEISQSLFGVGRREAGKRMSLVEKNPGAFQLLKDDEGVPLGYFSIMPLKLGNLENVLSQTVPVTIDDDEIAIVGKDNPIDLYLIAIGVKPVSSLLEKRIYGSRLVSGLIDFIIELGESGVKIKTIAARSNSPDGIRLMRHMGFTEIERATPERRTFIVDVESSGIPYVLRYKNALQEYFDSNAK